jgi:hypothetical protein
VRRETTIAPSSNKKKKKTSRYFRDTFPALFPPPPPLFFLFDVESRLFALVFAGFDSLFPRFSSHVLGFDSMKNRDQRLGENKNLTGSCEHCRAPVVSRSRDGVRHPRRDTAVQSPVAFPTG